MNKNNNSFLIILGMLVLGSMLICYLLINILDKNTKYEMQRIEEKIELNQSYAYENFKNIDSILKNHKRALDKILKNVSKNKPKRSERIKKGE